VADALGETAQSAAELAKSVGANADALSRILRLASAHDPPTLKLRRGKQRPAFAEKPSREATARHGLRRGKQKSECPLTVWDENGQR
jgi:hypothetical protein